MFVCVYVYVWYMFHTYERTSRSLWRMFVEQYVYISFFCSKIKLSGVNFVVHWVTPSLQHQHPIEVILWNPATSLLIQLPVNELWGESRIHPHERAAWISRFLASSWPGPGLHIHLGSEPTDGKALFFSFWLPAICFCGILHFWIHKMNY